MGDYHTSTRPLQDSPGLSPCIIPLTLTDSSYDNHSATDDGFLQYMKNYNSSMQQDEDQSQYDMLVLAMNTGDMTMLSHLPVPDLHNLDGNTNHLHLLGNTNNANNIEQIYLQELTQRDTIIKRQNADLEKQRVTLNQERENFRLDRENWLAQQAHQKDIHDINETNLKSVKAELDGKKLLQEQYLKDISMQQKEIVHLNKMNNSSHTNSNINNNTSSNNNNTNTNTSTNVTVVNTVYPELVEKLGMFFEMIQKLQQRLRSDEQVRNVQTRLVHHVQEKSSKAGYTLPLNPHPIQSTPVESLSPSIQRRGSQLSLRSPTNTQRRSGPASMAHSTPGGFRPLSTPVFLNNNSSNNTHSNNNLFLESSTTPLTLTRDTTQGTPSTVPRSLSLLVPQDLSEAGIPMQRFDESLEDNNTSMAPLPVNDASLDIQQFSFHMDHSLHRNKAPNSANTTQPTQPSIIQVYFNLLCKSLALEYLATAPKHQQHTLQHQWNVSMDQQFKDSVEQQIPFYQYHVFIRQLLHKQALVLTSPSLHKKASNPHTPRTPMDPSSSSSTSFLDETTKSSLLRDTGM